MEKISTICNYNPDTISTWYFLLYFDMVITYINIYTYVLYMYIYLWIYIYIYFWYKRGHLIYVKTIVFETTYLHSYLSPDQNNYFSFQITKNIYHIKDRLWFKSFTYFLFSIRTLGTWLYLSLLSFYSHVYVWGYWSHKNS